MCTGECFDGCNCSITTTAGNDGDPATVTIGTVTAGLSTDAPTVTNSGTPTNSILNFTIPAGTQGIAGRSSLGVINNTTSLDLTESQSGSIVYFNNTDLVADTLPVNPAVGTYFIFRCSQTPGANYTLTATSAKFIGYMFAKKAASDDSQFLPNGSTNNVITLNGSTTGGLIGTDFMVQYVGVGKWSVSGYTYGSGTLATSFSG